MSRDKKENTHKIEQFIFGIEDSYKCYAKKNLKFKINGQSISLEAFITQAIRDACCGSFIINCSIL